MAKGTVKWFSPEKGFGFILIDPETEIFVHYTSILGDGFRILHTDEMVEFEIVDTRHGPQAKNVRRKVQTNETPKNEPEPKNCDIAKSG